MILANCGTFGVTNVQPLRRPCPIGKDKFEHPMRAVIGARHAGNPEPAKLNDGEIYVMIIPVSRALKHPNMKSGKNKHCQCYLAEDVASSNLCDHVWHYKLSSLGGMVVNKLWDANLFVERDARVPKNTIVTLAACLVGAWIITPPVLLGLPGPCIKFKKALGTKRFIWASPDFMAMHPLEWQLILELMNSVINKWTLLPSADAWALKKAQYEKKGKPAEVLALVSAHECAANVKHCFGLDDFIKFIASLDVTKGSIGSFSM